MVQGNILKKLSNATKAGSWAMLALFISVQEVFAQSAGSGSGVQERVDAGSKALGGLLGVAFVVLMVRSMLKKKK